MISVELKDSKGEDLQLGDSIELIWSSPSRSLPNSPRELESRVEGQLVFNKTYFAVLVKYDNQTENYIPLSWGVFTKVTK